MVPFTKPAASPGQALVLVLTLLGGLVSSQASVHAQQTRGGLFEAPSDRDLRLHALAGLGRLGAFVPDHSGKLLHHLCQKCVAGLDRGNRPRADDLIFIEDYSNPWEAFLWRLINSAPRLRHLTSRFFPIHDQVLSTNYFTVQPTVNIDNVVNATN